MVELISFERFRDYHERENNWLIVGVRCNAPMDFFGCVALGFAMKMKIIYKIGNWIVDIEKTS